MQLDLQGIISTTAQSLTGYAVDNIHNGSVVAAMFMANPIPWDEGLYIRQPIQVERNTNGGSFTGMPVFNVEAQNTDTNLQWEARGDWQGIVIPLVEIAYNQTKAGVIKLVNRKMDVAINEQQDRLATTIYGLGLGEDISGLNLITDNATLTTSYGGLARATYGNYINGQVTAASGGTYSLALLGTQMDLCSPAGADAEGTDMVITTKAIWGYHEQIMDTKERLNFDSLPAQYLTANTKGGLVSAAEKGATSGFRAMFHRGIPIFKDEKCQSGRMYTLNRKYFDFAWLEIPELESISLANSVTKGVYEHRGQIRATAFQATKMQMPYNQLGKIGQIVLYGQFFNRNPVRSGVITGITGIA